MLVFKVLQWISLHIIISHKSEFIWRKIPEIRTPVSKINNVCVKKFDSYWRRWEGRQKIPAHHVGCTHFINNVLVCVIKPSGNLYLLEICNTNGWNVVCHKFNVLVSYYEVERLYFSLYVNLTFEKLKMYIVDYWILGAPNAY